MAHDAGHGGAGPRAPADSRAEDFLRVLAKRELGWVLAGPDAPPTDEPSDDGPPPAPAVRAVNRFRDAAGALITAGVIGEETAAVVLAGLLSDLEQRAKLPAAHPYRSLLVPRLWRPRPVTPPPDGPVRVVPVGKPVPFPDDGDENRLLHLLTLTLAPDLVVLSYAGRVRDPDQVRGPRHLRPPGRLPATPIGPFGPASVSGRLAFTDDRGTSYEAQTAGGGSVDGTWWSGAFLLSPALPDDARWIDVTAASATETVRIGLAGSLAPGLPHTGRGHRETASWAGALPPAGESPADRLLDLLAHDLLWSVLWIGDGGQAQTELATMIPALRSAGVVRPGSPALGRLTTLARRLGVVLPGRSRLWVPADTLPQAWAGTLAARDRRDGHDGLAPAAAVLPEVDGAVFAITGLHAAGPAVILHALAWGLMTGRTRFPRTGGRYSWTALDNTGRWHVARHRAAALAAASLTRPGSSRKNPAAWTSQTTWRLTRPDRAAAAPHRVAGMRSARRHPGHASAPAPPAVVDLPGKVSRAQFGESGGGEVAVERQRFADPPGPHACRPSGSAALPRTRCR